MRQLPGRDQRQQELRCNPAGSPSSGSDLLYRSKALLGSSEPAGAKAGPAAAPSPLLPARLRGLGRAPPSAPPGPARPGGDAGVRARARGAEPILLPSVRAPHAHSAPAVSVCLNRKADILVPHGPPRPTPPQAFATATRPLRSRGRSPSQNLPHQAAPGPDSRLPHRELSSLPLLSLHRAPTSPCPAGHRGSSPSSDGQNGRVRLSRGDHLLAESVRCVGAAPSKAGDAGLDRLQHFRVERAGPVAQAAAAAGTAPHPPFVFAFPLLPPLLPKGVSTLLLFLSPLRPISGRGTLHGEGGWGPLS